MYMHTTRLLYRSLLIFLALGCLAIPLMAVELPELSWEKRSDWISVKTDVTPNAVGDGVADDTAALQAALNKLTDGESGGSVDGPKTVYLPAGTYRITATLHLKKMTGAMIVGHGRTTRIVWDGPDGKAMFWSDGSRIARYIGITWDGRGKADRGFDHAATTPKSYFETQILHQYEAFVGMKWGVNLGVYRQGGLATDNVIFKNCLFDNCDRGISVDDFNYYHYAVDGCEFQHCGIGVMFKRGMGYVRNSHFQGSRETDLYCYLGYPVSPSIRRTTSVGSRRFVTFAGGGWTCNADIEDCRVSAWTDPEGAIVSDNAGSLLICDTVFSKPPTRHPPIKLANRVPEAPILVTISGNESKGTEKLIDEGPNARIITLPVGKRTRMLHADDETFFPGRVDVVPGKLFDARRDFGAKGDGKTDDTRAIQATIDAARANGHQAMAYLPAGLYRVSQTLTITGGDYRVGGGESRDHCRIQWAGAPGGVVISVDNPRNVKLEYVQVLGSERNGSCAIRQTGTGVGSLMRYEGISVPGAYVNMTPRPRGLELVGLGKRDTVLVEGVNDGDFHIASCGRATILVSSQTASPLLVDGDEPVRDGFLGFLAYMGLNAGDPMIHVRNNQNLVIGDAYLEVTPGTHVLLEGNPGEPAGYVTIMGVERYTAGPLAGWLTKSKKEQRRDIITIANYQGRYFEGTGEFSYPPKDGYLISQTGDRPLDIIFLGNCWMTLDDYFKQGKARPAIFADAPKYNLGKGARLIRLNDTMYDLQGSDKAGDRLMVGTWPDMLPNLIPPGGLEQASAALNDLQRMGAVDLKLNYGR